MYVHPRATRKILVNRTSPPCVNKLPLSRRSLAIIDMSLRLLAVLMGVALATIATLAEANTTAEQCRAQFPNNRTAQLQCVRRTYAPAKSTPKAPAAAVLSAPLTQQHVIFGLYDRRFPGFNNGKEHLGVDLAAPAGAWVRSICDGTVIYNNTSYADIVSSLLVIEHDCPQPLGLVYGYYGHVLSERIEGESVMAGDVIGAIKDWAGNSHLHLGLNTQFVEENWGVLPMGTTQRDVEALGWINPLRYLTHVTPPARAPARPQAAPRNKRK